MGRQRDGRIDGQTDGRMSEHCQVVLKRDEQTNGWTNAKGEKSYINRMFNTLTKDPSEHTNGHPSWILR